MTLDTIIIGIATIAGPIVAVLVGASSQKRLLKEQQKYELKRKEREQGFWEAWKIAERDRENSLRHELARVAEALEQKNQQI